MVNQESFDRLVTLGLWLGAAMTVTQIVLIIYLLTH